MLKSFEVSNFKSIKHLELELRPFMVLVGPNGAGKTNVVQSLELIGELLRTGSIEPVRELGYDEIIRREKKPARAGLTLGATFVGSPDEFVRPLEPVSAEPSHVEVELEWHVTIRGSVTDDDLSVAEERIVLKQGGAELVLLIKGYNNLDIDAENADDGLKEFARRFFRISRRLARPGAAFEDEIAVRVLGAGGAPDSAWLVMPRFLSPSMAREARVARIRLDASTLRRDAVSKEHSGAFIGPSGEGLALALDRLKGHGKEPSAAFKSLLQQLNTVYPRIEDIQPFRLQPGRLVLRFKERGIAEHLGQANVSDGVLHALALLLALEMRAKGAGVTAIEEPENAIHPWPLRQLMTRAQETKSKRTLLVTTHSNVVVDAVTDPGALFVVEQPDEKGTTVTPARDKEQALDVILKESGMKLGQVWLEGGLGGVPTRD